MNDGPEQILSSSGSGDVTVVRHYGARLTSGAVRWDPGYGSGIYIPYSREQAEADVRHTPGAELVTRTETTIVVTTTWEAVR